DVADPEGVGDVEHAGGVGVVAEVEGAVDVSGGGAGDSDRHLEVGDVEGSGVEADGPALARSRATAAVEDAEVDRPGLHGDVVTGEGEHAGCVCGGAAGASADGHVGGAGAAERAGDGERAGVDTGGPLDVPARAAVAEQEAVGVENVGAAAE